jgi:O-antigen/teichoic acid export membrane protein
MASDLVPVLRVALPVLCTAIVTAPWLLRLVYSSEFTVSATALAVLAVGSYVRLLSVANSYLLLGRRKTLLYFVCEGAVAVVLVGGTVAAGSSGSVTSTAVIASIAFIAHLVSTETCLHYCGLPSALTLAQGRLLTIPAVLGLGLVAFAGTTSPHWVLAAALAGLPIPVLLVVDRKRGMR